MWPWVLLASQDELRKTPSSSAFWEESVKDWESHIKVELSVEFSGPGFPLRGTEVYKRVYRPLSLRQACSGFLPLLESVSVGGAFLVACVSRLRPPRVGTQLCAEPPTGPPFTSGRPAPASPVFAVTSTGRRLPPSLGLAPFCGREPRYLAPRPLHGHARSPSSTRQGPSAVTLPACVPTTAHTGGSPSAGARPASGKCASPRMCE